MIDNVAVIDHAVVVDHTANIDDTVSALAATERAGLAVGTTGGSPTNHD